METSENASEGSVSVLSTRGIPSSSSPTILKAFLGSFIDEHYRTVYSFLDMFGFVGGIFELFKAFGFIFANFFASRSLYSSIISQLYHIESEEYSNQNKSNKNHEAHIKESRNSNLSYQSKL